MKQYIITVCFVSFEVKLSYFNLLCMSVSFALTYFNFVSVVYDIIDAQTLVCPISRNNQILDTMILSTIVVNNNTQYF